MKNPQVTDYQDPIPYLNEVLSYKKAKNALFSISAWAHQLGYNNGALLSEVLRGKRQPPANLRHSLAHNLKLSEIEKEHFETICFLRAAKSPEEKKVFFEKLRQLHPESDLCQLDIDCFHLLAEWHHLVILEMVTLTDFQEDDAAIAKRLGRGVTPHSVQVAIERLIRSGLLDRDEKGQLKKSQHHYFVGKDIPSEAIREHHSQFIDYAKESLSDPIESRDISGTLLGFSDSGLTKVKKLIKDFHSKLHEVAKNDGAPDKVYRVNVQLFPTTQSIEKETTL